MKSDEKLDRILAALQANPPALKEDNAANLTGSILAGIANNKQVANSGTKLLAVVRGIFTAAAALLLLFLLYQQRLVLARHPSSVVYNPYYKKAVREHGGLPQQKSISDLLVYYPQHKKGKGIIASLKDQYNHSSTKK